MEQFLYDQDVSSQVVFTTTGDKVTFTPSQPIDVIGFGLITDALLDVGAGMVLKLDHRPTAGSDSSRTDGLTPDGAASAQNLSTSTTDIAAGDFAYVIFTRPYEVDPGEQLVAEVTDAADTAGTGFIFLIYQKRPFAWKSNSSNVPYDSRMSANGHDLTP